MRFGWIWLAVGLLVVGMVAARETKRHRDTVRARAEQAARAAQAEQQRQDSIARDSAASQPAPAAAPPGSLSQAYGAALRAARGIYTLQFVDRELETQRAQALAQELETVRAGVEALQGEIPSEKLDALRTHNETASRQLDELNVALGGNPPDFATASARARVIEQELAAASTVYNALAGDPRFPSTRPRVDLRQQYRRVPMSSTRR